MYEMISEVRRRSCSHNNTNSSFASGSHVDKVVAIDTVETLIYRMRVCVYDSDSD